MPFFQGKADFKEKYPQVRMWCNSENRKEAEPGDILISVRAPVGSVNICNQKSIIGRGLSAIRPFPNLNGEFLYYFFKSNEQKIANLGTGSTFKAITQETLGKIDVPLPPITDQIRIAHLLGKVEGLIAQRKQHLQQLDDLLKTVFLEMFGDPVRMKNQPHFQFGNYLEFLTSGSRGWAKYYSDSGNVFLRINNVKDTRIKLDDIVYVDAPKSVEANRTRVKAGDLLLSITADLGRTAVVPSELEGAYINQHLALIRILPDEGLNPIFLAWYFTMPYGNAFIQKKNREGVKAGLNFDDIRGLQIVKPAVQLQNQFANIVEKVEDLKSLYQQSLSELENLYGALSQKAFKGELDLSRVVLPVDQAETREET